MAESALLVLLALIVLIALLTVGIATLLLLLLAILVALAALLLVAILVTHQSSPQTPARDRKNALVAILVPTSWSLEAAIHLLQPRSDQALELVLPAA